VKNIMVTEFGEDQENLCIFTDTLRVLDVKERLDQASQKYVDVMEVQTEDLQYYIYEAMWLENRRIK
jgi:hypothetical protein